MINFILTLLSVPLTLAIYIFVDVHCGLPSYFDMVIATAMFVEGVCAVVFFNRMKKKLY